MQTIKIFVMVKILGANAPPWHFQQDRAGGLPRQLDTSSLVPRRLNAVISDAVLEIRVAPAGCRAAVAMRMNRGER